jgi:hypothetical protein
MFNNRFNSTHKDPLVEAVKQAQQDGETRRQAEAYVNEQFGVYSRNAVVREDLAAYDAAIEEAYKCMKEGKPLDPVGREDKDIDNDGDHDKSDKYLLNRRKAIGNAMGKRMEEGAMDSDVVGGGAVTKDNKPVVSSTAPKVNTSGPSASDKAGLAAKIGAMKEEKLDELKKTTLGSYVGKAANANYGKEKLEREKGVKLAMDKIKGRYGVVKATEETQIDEVSKGRAISAYRQKEGEERDTSKLHGLIKRKFGKETAKHAERAGGRDTGNLIRRGEDRGKEDSIARDQRLGSAARKTKSGKVHKQDTTTLKGNIKRRLGSHTKPKNLPEEVMKESIKAKLLAKYMKEDQSF